MAIFNSYVSLPEGNLDTSMMVLASHQDSELCNLW